MAMTMDDDGAILVHLTNPGGIVGGTGVTNQITYWTDTDTIGGDAGLTYDAATDSLTIAGNILMADDKFIGIGAAAERIIFNAAGDISFMGCDVGIGTTTPSTNLHIVGADADDVRVRLDVHSNTNWHAPGFQGRRAGGTAAAKTYPVSGDYLLRLIAQGWNESAGWFDNSAYIDMVADGNWGAGNYPGKVTFCTDNDGSPQERMVIKYDGKVGIGVVAPLAQLHVDQSSSSAAIPVLYLDQGDISEEMIEFACTIGAGNAIEAVGGKTLTTTHFIKVTLPGALTRYIPVGTIA